MSKIILENKVVLKFKLIKNVNDKKCAPQMIFFYEKFFRKIRILLDIENWLWKSESCKFWQLLLKWRQDWKLQLSADFFRGHWLTKIIFLMTLCLVSNTWMIKELGKAKNTHSWQWSWWHHWKETTKSIKWCKPSLFH